MNHRRSVYLALGVAALLSAGPVVYGQTPATSTGLELNDQGIVFPDGTVQTTAAGGETRPLYYLEVGVDGYDGAATISACDAGFHFASIYEIVDPSNLRYDTTRGATAADSGGGPPQTSQGWIRTGDIGTAQNNVGFANCGSDSANPWTSNASEDKGTYAWLADPLAADWNSPASKIAPWSAGTAPCNISFGVWCIENYPGSGGM